MTHRRSEKHTRRVIAGSRNVFLSLSHTLAHTDAFATPRQFPPYSAVLSRSRALYSPARSFSPPSPLQADARAEKRSWGRAGEREKDGKKEPADKPNNEPAAVALALSAVGFIFEKWKNAAPRRAGRLGFRKPPSTHTHTLRYLPSYTLSASLSLSLLDSISRLILLLSLPLVYTRLAGRGIYTARAGGLALSWFIAAAMDDPSLPLLYSGQTRIQLAALCYGGDGDRSCSMDLLWADPGLAISVACSRAHVRVLTFLDARLRVYVAFFVFFRIFNLLIFLAAAAAAVFLSRASQRQRCVLIRVISRAVEYSSKVCVARESRWLVIFRRWEIRAVDISRAFIYVYVYIGWERWVRFLLLINLFYEWYM